MPTTQIMRGLLRGIRAASLRPLTVDGLTPSPAPDGLWLSDITDAPIQMIIEQGERAVDRADGVGVIAIHEEDDTLVGTNLDLTAISLDFRALALAAGGTLVSDESGAVTGWTAPSIQAQRDSPVRFELDVYVAAIGTLGQEQGFLRHRFYYCRAMPQQLSHSVGGIARPGFAIKARPHPGTGLVHAMDFVAAVPAH